MTKKISTKKLIALALVICLALSFNYKITASNSSSVSDEIMSQLKNDTILCGLSNEDDVISYITEKLKKTSKTQGEIDRAIKEYYKSKTDVSTIDKQKDQYKNSDKDLLLKKKNENTAKMSKVESEIQKNVSYVAKANYEKNIEFLLANKDNINLNKELITYYISGYCHHVKNINTKKSLEKYLGIEPEKSKDIDE